MSGTREEHKLEEYASFDILRFVLASVVMLNHIGVITWINAGNLAVQIFFALSGWLIGGILCRARASDLSLFYFGRATRIWIPYVIAVAALYTVSFVHEGLKPRSIEFLAYDLTFTHNWFAMTPDVATALAQMPLAATGNHFWSLAVEEQFYLLSPLVITLVPLGGSVVTWACIAIVACATKSQYGAISLGVLAVVLSIRHPGWYLRPVARGALLCCVSGLGMILANDSWYERAAPLFSACTVLLLATPLRRNTVTRWLGGVSFPFYLLAWIGTFLFHALTKRFGWMELSGLWPVEFALGLGVAAVAYHLVDVHVMARRSTFYRPTLGWALGATGYALVLIGIGITFAHLIGPTTHSSAGLTSVR